MDDVAILVSEVGLPERKTLRRSTDASGPPARKLQCASR
jgi:hypothetical protein